MKDIGLVWIINPVASDGKCGQPAITWMTTLAMCWGLEVTQEQRTQEPTTQVTLRRRDEDRTQAIEQKPKESLNRESLGARLRALYTTEHVLNMWYTCGYDKRVL